MISLMTPLASKLDSLVLLWIMTPLGFLITVLQQPGLRYLNANHTLVSVLLAAIAVRWHFQAPSRQVALRLLLAALLMSAFLGIEWLHFLAGRQTIDALEDPRMIVYSPFYGGIIIFVLYAIYLGMLDASQQQRHMGFFVRLMCWFHVVFLVYWVLLYVGWIPAIPKADLLHSNSVAYGALFVICLMLFYRRRIGMDAGSFLAFLAVNVAVILANRTRGAIIALLAVMLHQLLEALGGSRRAVLSRWLLGAMIGIGLAIALADGALLSRMLGQDFDALGPVLAQIASAYESGEPYVSVSPSLVSDESSLSAFSRIGSNYFSLLSFLDNPLLGIGQAEAYSIKVLGAGVHSLHFLIANATGLAGLALFAALLVALASAHGPVVVTGRLAVMFILCFGYMLVFVNSMPVYFALVLIVLAERQMDNPMHAAGMVPEVRIGKYTPVIDADGQRL